MYSKYNDFSVSVVWIFFLLSVICSLHPFYCSCFSFSLKATMNTASRIANISNLFIFLCFSSILHTFFKLFPHTHTNKAFQFIFAVSIIYICTCSIYFPLWLQNAFMITDQIAIVTYGSSFCWKVGGRKKTHSVTKAALSVRH